MVLVEGEAREIAGLGCGKSREKMTRKRRKLGFAGSEIFESDEGKRSIIKVCSAMWHLCLMIVTRS